MSIRSIAQFDGNFKFRLDTNVILKLALLIAPFLSYPYNANGKIKSWSVPTALEYLVALVF